MNRKRLIFFNFLMINMQEYVREPSEVFGEAMGSRRGWNSRGFPLLLDSVFVCLFFVSFSVHPQWPS